MREHLYGVPSELIALALFVLMALAMEFGFRVGQRAKAVEAVKEHINQIQGAMLGILALLLGFTFSLALQRYDNRAEAVTDEANAIGTAQLRLQLLPPPARDEARALLARYVDVRIKTGALTQLQREEHDQLIAQTQALQGQLWALATRALQADNVSYTPVLFAEALNTMFDSQGKREATLGRHVPEVVLMLMYATFVLTGGVVGYAAGVNGHRPSLANHVMVLLIVVLAFITLDLDRPRRGLIQVSIAPLRALQTPPPVR
jgi:hypothetical protein